MAFPKKLSQFRVGIKRLLQLWVFNRFMLWNIIAPIMLHVQHYLRPGFGKSLKESRSTLQQHQFSTMISQIGEFMKCIETLCIKFTSKQKGATRLADDRKKPRFFHFLK